MVATFLCVVHGRRAAKKSWRNNRNHQADVLLSARDTRGAGNNYGPTIAITVKPPTLRGFQDARTPTTPSTNSWHGQKHTRREREGSQCTGKKYATFNLHTKNQKKLFLTQSKYFYDRNFLDPFFDRDT